MDPMSLLSAVPSFTGGTAGPSNAGGGQTVNNTMGSAFSVGKGASAGATAMDMLSRALPYALLLVAALLMVRMVKK